MASAAHRLEDGGAKRRGWFWTIDLPAAILQIVLVGPGFSTGREVLEFAGRFGALGVWSVGRPAAIRRRRGRTRA